MLWKYISNSNFNGMTNIIDPSLQMHTNVNGIHIEHLLTYGTYKRTETMKICKTLLCKSFANNLILLKIITKQQAQTEADICDVKEILM